MDAGFGDVDIVDTFNASVPSSTPLISFFAVPPGASISTVPVRYAYIDHAGNYMGPGGSVYGTNANVPGTLTASGNASFGNAISVSGTLTANGTIASGGGITAAGAITGSNTPYVEQNGAYVSGPTSPSAGTLHTAGWDGVSVGTTTVTETFARAFAVAPSCSVGPYIAGANPNVLIQAPTTTSVGVKAGSAGSTTDIVCIGHQ